MPNPKIIKVIYTALVDNRLIKDEGEDDFKKAFLKGEGSIVWLCNTGFGTNILSHLIRKLVESKIIKNPTNSMTEIYKITSNIFKDNQNKLIKIGTLANSSEPKNAKAINDIVASLKNLY